ncbi:hypothetical protein GGX14DRAFT_352846 [Mycena pura]|uniref:Uncharacterized protein n=1 Tax=Mycena pura TaxID=153505 RepID=A0AAD6YLG0_9AGAR|nr:hypothetical protein GGX14DRAFT_352846 [Mycena pura]
MLADILDNLPRCRFTNTQMSLVLRFAKALGAPNVPTLKGLRKTQHELQSACFTEPLKVESFLGNIFYVNNIWDTIARDFANPTVAAKIELFPEEVDDGTPISEIWQAERWKEYAPNQLTPMFSRGSRRFWIDELALCKNGTFVIPLSFIKRNGILSAYVRVVSRASGHLLHCTHDSAVEVIAADELEHDYTELINTLDTDSAGGFSWTVASRDTVPLMPNPKRTELKIDEDTDLAVVMVDVYQDDTSGNVSKQFDKHIVTCIRNGCLPGRTLQQQYHCHCVSSSQHASSPETLAAIRDQLKSTETKPVRCYNVHTKRKMAIILRAPGLPADNPQQSEEASHIGCNANFPCRKCMWGGTSIEKTSDKIFRDCHLPSNVKRSAAQIRDRLREQLRLATRGDMKTIKESWTATGTKDKVTVYWIEQALAQFASIRNREPAASIDEISARVQTWLDAQPGDKMNPLLDITGLDPSQDTPVEVLHTVLLGVMKYIWHFMNTRQWSDADRCLLAIRLQSMDISGLTVPPIRAAYMMQYRNALIGKHFKTLMQTLALHVHEICTPEEFTLIKSAGDLGARLWIPEIDKMDFYLKDLGIASGNLLDAFDAVDPLRILVKIKLHLLTHLPDDIRRFGPAIRFSTEIFESCNAIFRACSVRSNRLAPSRDIARKFASMERVKHLLSGGFWLEPKKKMWVQAGAAARKILIDDPVFQRHLGWTPPQTVQCGVVQLPSEKKEPAVPWQSTKASAYWRDVLGTVPDLQSMWRLALTIVAVNGDVVRRRSWVFARQSGNYILGRIAEILVGSETLVTLERFICTDTLHVDYGWPVARRPSGTEITQDDIASFIIVAPCDIQFFCSIQHDCRHGQCKPAIAGKERQEREETTRDISLIKHTDDDHFIVNMSGFHNFMELRRILPASLTTLAPLHIDREAFHRETAAKAQELRMSNREKAAAKRRANTAEKKRLAAVAAMEATEAAAEAPGVKGKAEAEAAAAQEENLTGSEEEDDLQDPDEQVQTPAGSEDEFDDRDDDSDWAPRTKVTMSPRKVHPRRQGRNSTT